MYAIKLSSGKYKILDSLKGEPNDGAAPYGAPVPDVLGGIFYILTAKGGKLDYGTFCKIKPTGKESIIDSFDYSIDGGDPVGQAFYDPTRKAYVFTTTQGGNKGGKNGAGVITEYILK